MKHRLLQVCAVVGIAVLLHGAAAQAAHTVPLPIAELADHAAQVIVGEVAAVRSYWAENPRRIESEVAFVRVEYLKGAPAGGAPEFTLIVPGGQVGEMRMRLCCAPEFATGQRWCLFLLESSLLHPVVGLNQGAFLIAGDAGGVERVHNADGQPVLGFDEDGLVRIGGEVQAHAPVTRAANNLRILPREPVAAVPARTLTDFLVEVQPVVAASRRHALQAPAGRYTPAPFTVTTLKVAGGAGAAARDGIVVPLRGADAVQSVQPAQREEPGR